MGGGLGALGFGGGFGLGLLREPGGRPRPLGRGGTSSAGGTGGGEARGEVGKGSNAVGGVGKGPGKNEPGREQSIQPVDDIPTIASLRELLERLL